MAETHAANTGRRGGGVPSLKKTLALLLAAAVLAGSMAGCAAYKVACQAIALGQTALTLNPGGTARPDCTVTLTVNGEEQTLHSTTPLPEDTDPRLLEALLPATPAWHSTDEAVATVDAETGAITAVAPGAATIVATVAPGGDQPPLTAEMQVTVGIPVTGAQVRLAGIQPPAQDPPAQAEAGAPEDAQPEDTPEGEPAEEDAQAPEDEADEAEPEPEADPQPAEPEKITALSIKPGHTATLLYEILPADATDTTLTFASGDDAVFTVDAGTGAVTARAHGSAALLVTVQDPFNLGAAPVTLEVPVTVETLPESLTLDQTEASLYVGGSATLAATVAPAWESLSLQPALLWSTDNEAVCTVDEEGGLHAEGEGTAVITAALEGTGLAASCTVTVKPKPQTAAGGGGGGGASGGYGHSRDSEAYPVAQAVVAQVISADMSQRQKADALSRWLYGNVSFMEDQSEEGYKVNFGHEAYGALVNRHAACSGFCNAYTMLLGLVGMQGNHVNKNQWAHQWVDVYLADEGVTITVDPTSGIFDGNWYSLGY